MHIDQSQEDLLLRIEDLESRLMESEQLIEAIKAGEVDAFALNTNSVHEIYTLQTGDYAYRVLIEEFGEGAVNLSEEGLIVYTNTYFLELLHLKYQDVIGRSIFSFIDPGSIQTFNDLFSKGLVGKSKGEINLLVNGKNIPAYISLTSLQPSLATVGMIITDLSQKKEHEEIVSRYQRDLENKNLQLEQSNSELNSFTYIASHDLQEPLRKIQTFCQRIMETSGNQFSAATNDYFQRILNASKRMQHMIGSFLEYSRMNSEAIERTSIDLNKTLEEVISERLEEASNEQVQVTIEKLPTISGIPDQIRQLFSNLLSNAIKYKNLKGPSRIHVTSSQQDGYWKITVSDNGIGFDPQYADRIFELFQRLHGRSEYEGTGIGLAICKKIVQNHGGFIKAIGTPGAGASFEIYLPV
jgi:PAS domain S-box-containing protein